VTLKQFVTLLIILTTIPVVTFVANYFFRSKWYKNAAGWNLLLFMAVVAELLIFSLYVRITHHQFPGWFGAICWIQLMAVSWWRLILLIIAQARQKDAVRRAKEREHLLEADR
jgi:hypothetical protein